MRVAAGNVLHLPQDMHVDVDRIWLREGGVVDADDPFTKHCLKGQEYKLEPASEKAEVSVSRDRRILTYRDSWIAERKKRRDARRKARDEDARPTEGDEDADGDLDLDEDLDEDDGETETESVEATAGGEIQKPDKSKRGGKSKD